ARKRLPRRDGQARVAVQAARVHLPELRDLRRRGIGVGLR
ncbi:MAG: Glycyl-tRNA synthetase, partial [uncultured Gemmatimonadaceae bacterium]